MEELLRNVNQFNTPLDSKYYADLSRDVVDDIHASIDEIIFIRRLVSNDIKMVCDIEKDEDGKIIIDVTDPHVLEDMTFFTEAGDHFRKHGYYTLLTPNKHPKSAYYQHWKEEKRRIREGLVREDGEWIPGDYYWYLNYCPIMLTKRVNKGGKRADRLHDFANVWLGDYLFFHYKNQAEYIGQHIEVLKCRGIGASFKMGSIGPRNALFKPRSKTFYVASNMQYLNKDGVLTKSWDYLDFNALNTPFPRLRLKDTQLEKRIGYKDVRSGAERGMKSDIIGLSLNDDPDKARGKRGDIIFEEYGSFPHIKKAWNVSRDAVEDGENVFAQMCAMGTGGTEGSDFEGAEDMFYHPTSYNIMPLANVFDRNTEGKGEAGFFWGAYLNRANCYDENGMPDVTKALKEIYLDYEKIRKSSSDTRALTQRRAEKPITPQDSMMKIDGTMFPVGEIRDYLETVLPMIDEFVGPHYIGDLAFDSNGKVVWKVGGYKKPIREFPLQDNKHEGAIEIFEMPHFVGGEAQRNRYIGGIDGYDDDASNTVSLGSIFILDLFTDRIVAEYTGRPKFANDFFEICRRMLLFYNAIGNYEAHPYSQLVRIPSGETKLWGDISVGDELFAPNGGVVKVVAIPIDEKMPIYKITLNDGREIMASDNHIWSLFKLNDHPHSLENYTTSDILRIGTKNKYKQNTFFVPNGGAVSYDKKDVPIDPYTMGLIISEGCLTGSHCSKNQVQISSSTDDVEFYKTLVPYEIKYSGTKGFSWNLIIPECRKKIDSLGLLKARSETKFIPDTYLHNSYDIRLSLLRGMMDGDGHATNGGSPVYVTSSDKLSLDFMSLCRSLGFNCKRTINKTMKLDSYKVVVYTDEKIFSLPRKSSVQHVHNRKSRGSKASAYMDKTAITSVEFSHYEMGKCVTVDSSDGLYLIGDYVVTHNCDKKGMFGYFDRKNSLHLLSDTLQSLRDIEMVKGNLYGNKSKGTNSGKFINARARRLIADYMMTDAQGESGDNRQLNLHKIRSIGLLLEALKWNVNGNFDRISACGMLMLLREDRQKYLENTMRSESERRTGIQFDPYFLKNSHGLLSYNNEKFQIDN